MRWKLAFLSTLIVGGLFGGAITLGIVGHDLDLLYFQIAQNRLQYDQLSQENKQLADDLKKRTDASVRKIRKLDIHINSDDESLKIQTTRYVQDKLQFLIGRPLSELTPQPDMINHILNRRIVTFDTSSYMIHVDAVVLDETIRVWLSLESK